MRIIVNDANILIDLVKLDILLHFFQLPFSFHTTDIIFNELDEEQQELLLPYIETEQLIVEGFTGEELIAISTLKDEKNQLSMEDCSAVFCAQKLEADLISSDKNLRSFARSKAIPIRGHLWVLDRLFEHQLLTGVQTIELLLTLQTTINPKLGLPTAACEELKEKWKNLE
jgi:predicted nucleic acid-binding protein